MPVFSLEESRRSRQAPSASASTPVETPMPGGDEARDRHPAGGDVQRSVERTAEQVYIDGLREELDGYYVGLKTLAHLPPEQVFHWLSAISARLVEIRAHLHRSESRRCAGLRTREVDPLLEEVDRQFRLHSRIAAMAELEWRMQGGAPA